MADLLGNAGGSNANAGATANNPYGLPPSLLALMANMQGLAKSIGPDAASSSAYMRPNAQAIWTPGSINSLLAEILKMRNSQTQGLADPFQAGVSMPRLQLTSGSSLSSLLG